MLAAICGMIMVFADSSRPADPDPVTNYYWNNAAEKARSISPEQVGLSFVLTARTFCHQMGPGGSIVATDTVVCDYFYTGGILDSLHLEDGKDGCARKVDLTFPYIFGNIYELGRPGYRSDVRLFNNSSAGRVGGNRSKRICYAKPLSLFSGEGGVSPVHAIISVHRTRGVPIPGFRLGGGDQAGDI